MHDFEDSLGELVRACMVYQHDVDTRGGPRDIVRNDSERAEARLRELFIRLAARAEKAEAERDTWRAECESISKELGLPPTIRPAEGELRRMVEDCQRLKRERDAIRTLIADLLAEVTKTRQWRTCKGMRPATDTSELAGVPESALQAIERWFREVKL